MLDGLKSRFLASKSPNEDGGEIETSVNEFEIEDAELEESKRILDRMLHGKVPPIVIKQQRHIINLQTDLEGMKHRIRIAELKVARVSKTTREERQATVAIAKSDEEWEQEIGELKDQFNINIKQLGIRADRAEEKLLQEENRSYALAALLKENGIDVPD